MSKNSVVSLTLQVKGQQASQELKRIATEQVTAVQRINTEQQKLAPIQAGQINNAKKSQMNFVNKVKHLQHKNVKYLLWILLVS
jgi:hypothetical protein